MPPAASESTISCVSWNGASLPCSLFGMATNSSFVVPDTVEPIVSVPVVVATSSESYSFGKSPLLSTLKVRSALSRLMIVLVAVPLADFVSRPS